MATSPKDDERSETTTYPKERRAQGLQAGEILAGRYELVSKLGQGGSGEVWKAVHRRLGINVAVKTPLVRDSETLERFRREAQALCLIDSEHVLRCFEYGEKPIPFLVMELLKGESLADRLEREGPMPLATVKGICKQLCKGLQAAHRIGVIHRDLKPGNIHCIEDRFKIVDFGLMKLVESTQDPATKLLVTGNDELTRANAFMGTLVYMSPEQLKQANRVDFRSDLWSLAVVLYRLLTAQQPFAAKADYQICLNIVEQPHPPITKFNPDLSPEAEVFFRVGLDKDPLRRFGSAVQLGEAFAAIPELDQRPTSRPLKGHHVSMIASAELPSLGHMSASTRTRLEEMSTDASIEARPIAQIGAAAKEQRETPENLSIALVIDQSAVPQPAHLAVQDHIEPEKGPSTPATNHHEQVAAPPMERVTGKPDEADELGIASAIDRRIDLPSAHSEKGPSLGGGRSKRPLVFAASIAIVMASGGIGLFALAKPHCAAGTGDCDGSVLSSCETSVTTVENCGVCGLHCDNPHGSTACTNGVCVPVCADGYADCDGSLANGCEASLGEPEHCNTCNVSCANGHGTSACSAGRCVPICASGYADCDQNSANGCEVDLRKESSIPGRCPPTTISRHESGALGIDVDSTDDGFVMWTVPSSGKIYRVAKHGGAEKELLFGGAPKRIVFDDGIWYWTDTSARSIYKLLADDTKKLRMGDIPGELGALDVRDKQAFASVWHRSEKQLNIVTTKREYRASDYTVCTISGSSPTLFGIAVGSESVYFIEPGQLGNIRATRHVDKAESWLVAVGQENPSAIALDLLEKSVVWANQGRNATASTGSIVIAHVDGSGKMELASQEHDPRSLAVDETWVYWTTADGAVKKKRIDGTGDAVVLASSEQDPRGIAIDKTRVYWVNFGSGEVRSVVK